MICVFFFFKQKTAYEMRISDWSSDVCSSDLQAAAEGRRIDLAKCSERGRDGVTGARGHGKIGFASLRGGTVAGDHDVIFAGPEEMITLAHRAENRMIFARGAVKAALDRKSTRLNSSH